MSLPTLARRTPAVIGAVSLAAALAGAATLAWTASAAPGDHDGTFVPITPCRLFDDRPAPDTVGAINTPLIAGGDRTQQITGSIGDCDIPGDAVAVALNVTIANPTAQSNLRLWPADQPKPDASNLNWLAGQSPTPNKVDVKLSPTGAIKLANHQGSVNVIADAVGYYTAANLRDLDERVGDLHDRLAMIEEHGAVSGVEWIAFDRSGDMFGSSAALDGTTLSRPSGLPIGVYCLTLPIEASEFAMAGAVVSVQKRSAGASPATATLTSSSGHECTGTGFNVAVDTYDNKGEHADMGFAVQIPRAPAERPMVIVPE